MSKTQTWLKRMLAQLLALVLIVSMVAPAYATDTGSAGETTPTESAEPSAFPEPTPETTPEPEKTTQTVTVNVEFGTALAVEVDEKSATKQADGTYQVAVDKADEHTAKALVQIRGEYYILTKKTSDINITLSNADKSAVLSENKTLEPVELNATSKGTSATSDGHLLVSWDAIGLSWGGISSDGLLQGRAKPTENGVEFSTTGTESFTKTSLNDYEKIDDARLIATSVTVTVEQCEVEAEDITMSVTPTSGTIGDTIKIQSVTASKAGDSNYAKLQGKVSWKLSDESQELAKADKTDNPTSLTLNAQGNVYLTVTVEDSTFYKGVSGRSNAINVVRKSDSLEDLKNIETDADVLVKQGIELPKQSKGGQKVTYTITDSKSGLYVEDGKLGAASAETAVGEWDLTAKVAGNAEYGEYSKTVKVTVKNGASFANPEVTSDWLNLGDLNKDATGRTYTQKITDSNEEHTWTYAITAVTDSDDNVIDVASDEEAAKAVAEINSETGKVTMKTAGEITVTATRSDSKNIIHSYTLTVKKTTLIPVFEDDSMTVSYGTENSWKLPLKVKTAPESNSIEVPEDATISWTVMGDTKGISVPDNTFTVTRKQEKKPKTTTTTFIAEVNGDQRYAVEGSTATMNLTVAVGEITADKLGNYVDISAPNEDSGWYVPSDGKTAAENVLVKSRNRKYSLSLNADGEFKESLTLAEIVNDITAEGETLGKDYIIYIREGKKIYYAALPGYKVDNTAPTAVVTYSKPVADTIKDTITYLFYNKKSDGKLTINITPTDETSGISSISYGKVEGDKVSYIDFTAPEGGFVSGTTYSYTVDTDGLDLADFTSVLRFKVVDNAGLYTEISTVTVDKEYTDPTVVVDSVNPRLTVSYDGATRYETEKGNTSSKSDAAASSKLYSNSTITATLKVDDANFNPDDMTVVLLKDGKATEAKVDWKDNSATITLEKADGEEHVYQLQVTGTDWAKNELEAGTTEFGTFDGATYTSNELILDGEAPTISVSYSMTPSRFMKHNEDGTLTAYDEENKKDEAEVVVFKDTHENGLRATITVDEKYFNESDFTARLDGKDYDDLTWSHNEGTTIYTASIDLSAEADKETIRAIEVTGSDISGEKAVAGTVSYGKVEEGTYTSKSLLLDNLTPKTTVAYNNPVSLVKDDVVVSTDAGADKVVYNGDIVSTVTVDESYFDSNDCTVTVTEDGKELKDFTFEWEGQKATVTIKAEKSAEHIYVITVTGTDIAGHPFQYTAVPYGADDEDGTYVSKSLLIDTKAPEVDITYSNTANSGAKGGFYTARSAKITVDDASFDSSKVTDNYTVSGVDAKNAKVNTSAVALSDWEGGNRSWTSSVDFAVEANYSFAMTVVDNAGNKAEFTTKNDDEDQNRSVTEGAYATQFTVDNTLPEKLTFRYSQPVSSALITGIFYRYFSASAPLQLTVSTEDSISGVQTVSYVYNRAADASATNQASLTKSYDSYAQGSVYVLGPNAVSESETFDGTSGQLNGDFSYTIMDYAGNVRTTGDASHTASEHDPSGAVREVVDTICPGAAISYTGFTNSSATANNENPNGDLAYYFRQTSLSVPVTINEANFYPEDVTVSVSRNGSAYQKVAAEWTHGSGDNYTTAVYLSEPDSYYYIKVEYTDRSGNQMQTGDKTNSAYSTGNGVYTSPRIVLDTTAPAVTVSYSGSYRTSDMDYYNTTAVATIRVKEKNFSADEATKAITITGQNIDGGATGVPAVTSWTYVGDDTYSATITYSTDSRYTFDMKYSDLAGIAQSTDVKKTFTVDMTPPTNLGISYSTDVWGLTTGSILWYDAPVSVTLTATDLTAGVESITYSYPTKNGVSTVNVGMGDVTVSINAASSTATYTFTIPSSVLVSANQFNGTVNFTVTDRSGNVTSYSGTEELVVDNIAPNATITFTKPVSSDNDTDYYSTAFDATIEINEANFDASNVHISVTKDGVPYNSFTYTFEDESVDVHTAVIHFTEAGEYVITVSYTDQSKNEMEGDKLVSSGTYTSRKLVIDLTDPEILIEDMKGNEDPDKVAYDDEKITFTVTFEDEHLLSDGLEVELSSFRDQKNTDETKLDLSGYDYASEEKYVGSPVTVTAGETYTIDISNLENDAVYFLNASVKDQAGRTASESIMFSVNRDGSTYYISDATAELCNSYTNHTSAVEIHEINVEELEKKDVSVIRDASSATLEEGSEFDVDNTTGEDEHWNDYTYNVYDSNFESEGVYTVQTSSTTEKTQKESSSSNSGLEIKFVMDTTEPEAYINGIANNEKYDSREQPVTINISDNVRLASAEVYVDGVVVASDNFDGTSGTIETTIPEKNADQTVYVVAYDQAGNNYTTEDVTVRVTSNVFFLYLEYWIIGLILLILLLAVIIGVIVSRNKKKHTA